ncbi:MAG: MOSC domain-containing protein [Egibacteraceae bacterium]
MGSQWTRSDVAGTLQVLDAWWDQLTEGVAQDLVESPPAPGEPSVAAIREASITRLLDARGADPDGVLAVVQAALADLSAAGRTLVRLGVGPVRTAGAVAGIHRSGGGVPKLPVAAAAVGLDGVEGDRQADRRFHGRLWQALCLWSAEVIAELHAEGHPIAAGNAGENLALSGLDWAALRSGTRLRVGGVLAELSLPATPCAKNARWFVDGDFMRMSHDRHPGWSRWYATVLEPGVVAVGDPAVVEPDGGTPRDARPTAVGEGSSAP